MRNLPKTLAAHFSPLHKKLDDLSAQADMAWTEGGMTWSVEYKHRMARSIKIGGNYVGRSKKMDQDLRLQEYKKLWAKLIWKAQGDLGNLMDLAGGAEWGEEENRLIDQRMGQAEKIIGFFESSGAGLVRMSFFEDASSMSVDCVSLFGRDALVHHALWSID